MRVAYRPKVRSCHVTHDCSRIADSKPSTCFINRKSKLKCWIVSKSHKR